MASHKKKRPAWAPAAHQPVTALGQGQGYAPDKPLASPLADALSPKPPVAPGGPHVDPFLTPADLLAINAFDTNDTTARTDLVRSLADLTTNTNFQIGQIGRQATQQTSDAKDNAAARGLFQSSIKDANLYDIEAQKRINSGLLNDRLTTAQADAAARLVGLNTSKNNFDTAMLGQQVQNAQAITPVVPPTSSPVAATSAPKPSTTPPAPAGHQAWAPAAKQPKQPLASIVKKPGTRFPAKPKQPKYTGQVKVG